MFYFDAVNDIDLDSYAYQLYDNSAGTGTPVATGRNKANVFTISVTNSTDSTPKTYYGRVAVVNSAGTVGTYTSLVSSGPTPLIGNQYINSLTAAKITAGTIGAHEITLGGATSIIKSSTYNFASPTTTGWFIKGDGSASIGGSNGINFNGSTTAPAITLGSNVTILSGAAVPDSSGVGFTGLTISTAVGSIGGIQLGTNANNQWLTSGYFRTGNAGKYILFDPAANSGAGSFSISSDVTIGGTTASLVVGNAATGASALQSGNGITKNGSNQITQISGSGVTITSNGNTSGQRVQLDSSGLNAYNSAGTRTVSINSDGSASFTGEIRSTSGNIGEWLINDSGFTKTVNYANVASTTSTLTTSSLSFYTYTEEDGLIYADVRPGSFTIVGRNGTTQILGPYIDCYRVNATTVNASTVNASTVTGHVFNSTTGIRYPGPLHGSYSNMPSDYNFSLNFQYSNTGAYIYALVNGDNNAVRRITTTTSSDRRVKKNITPDVSSQLNKFYSLTPYEFEYNENLPLVGDNKFVPDGKKIVGLIADEVEELFPDYVLGKKETEYQQVDYQDFTKLLIAASIEQNKRIQELSAKVDELESRLV